MKICTKCKTSQPETNFYAHRGGLHPHCKSCQAGYYQKNRTRTLARLAAQLVESKNRVFAMLGDECGGCGFSDRRALELHHVQRDGKKERVSWKFRAAWVEESPERYAILCANCHRIEHAA